MRRVEAESICDALLDVAGRSRSDHVRTRGSGVHLTSFMEGRGRPPEKGPAPRRRPASVYLNVRRNFLNPMLLAFDAPVPFSTMGRRNVSHVPAQPLTLMNDPLVIGQAGTWADRELARSARSVSERLDPASTRPPSAGLPPPWKPAPARRFSRPRVVMPGTVGRSFLSLCQSRLGRPLPCVIQYERVHFR